MTRLKGKVAIVTGSGSGMGRAMILLMAREGAVVVVNDVNVEAMQGVVSEVKKDGGRAIGIKADVTVKSEIQDLAEAVVKEFGKIDLLVNNAGITRHKAFFEMSNEDWDAVMAVDLKGVFNCKSGQSYNGYS